MIYEWVHGFYLVVTSSIKQHECGCEDVAVSDVLCGFIPFQVYLFTLTTWVSRLTAFIYQYASYMRPPSEVLAQYLGIMQRVSIPGQSHRPYPPELKFFWLDDESEEQNRAFCHHCLHTVVCANVETTDRH